MGWFRSGVGFIIDVVEGFTGGVVRSTLKLCFSDVIEAVRVLNQVRPIFWNGTCLQVGYRAEVVIEKPAEANSAASKSTEAVEMEVHRGEIDILTAEGMGLLQEIDRVM